jgi:hypothetical protein
MSVQQKNSMKSSNSMNDPMPDDPCFLCLVRACCKYPCDNLRAYMIKVCELVESDLDHPVLDRFPKNLQDRIKSYIGMER